MYTYAEVITTFIWCVEWMRIHSSTYDKKVCLYTSFAVLPVPLLQLSLSREYLLHQVLCRSPCNPTPVPLELCVDLLDTALLPHELYAGVHDTVLLPFNW